MPAVSNGSIQTNFSSVKGEGWLRELGLDSMKATPRLISLRFWLRARGGQTQRIGNTDLRLVRRTSSGRRSGDDGGADGVRESMTRFLASGLFFEHGTLCDSMDTFHRVSGSPY
jgi:hypothetical protein